MKFSLILLAVFCILPTVGYTQYNENFEDLQASASGVGLAGQAEFEPSSDDDFRVYTYTGNSLGITSNPAGGAKFIAGIGPGPDITKRARAARPVSFGNGGIWEISYDVAVVLKGQATSGLEPIGAFQVSRLGEGADASAYFRNWMKWTGGGGSQQVPRPIDVGYFGFNEEGKIFGFYGDTPGKDWAQLPFNHWFRVSTTVDFDSNQVLKFSIKDLNSGEQTSFVPPGNVFLNGGRPIPPRPRCTQRSATPSLPGDCYLVPDGFVMTVFNEHIIGGRNVLAFDNVRINQANSPREGGFIYDNGPTRGLGGSAIGHMIAADDFRLAADKTISRVSIDVSDGPASDNKRWDGNIEWWVLTDNNGVPGTVIASGRGVTDRVHHMVETPLGFRSYTIDFTLDKNVSLQGAQEYWLALHLQNDYNRVSISWDYTDPFAGESEGGDVVPTNSTHRAKSGGTIINGEPSFPAGLPSASNKELAFRFLPKLHCFTIFGKTFCLSWKRYLVTISIFSILAILAIAGTVWGVWQKVRSRHKLKMSG